MSEIKLIEYEIFDNDNILLVFFGMEKYYKDKIIGEYIISKLTNGKYINYKNDELTFEYRSEKNKIAITNHGNLNFSDYNKKTNISINHDLISSVIPKLGLIINEINKNYDIIDLINKTFNIGE